MNFNNEYTKHEIIPYFNSQKYPDNVIINIENSVIDPQKVTKRK